VTAALAIASEDQYRVLRTYVTGADLRSTAASLSMDLDRVTGIVELVGFDRGRARRLVEEYDRGRRPAFAPPPAPVPAPIEKPEIAVTVEPTPDPSYESLLERAGRSGDVKLEKLAVKARELLVELEDRLTAFESAKEALAEIAALEAKLEAARAKLVSRRPSQRAERTGPDPKAVRAWAAENGVQVPVTGRVPQAVVDRYLAACGGPVGA
jgi:predicted ribosome quality control (RQC) complex YloA/Tae2 family protein